MCTLCGHALTASELDKYRQFALLNNQRVQVHSEYGQEQVKQRKEAIIKDKKLVLVLDLDHTLIHSKEYISQKPIMRHRNENLIQVVDPLKSIYEIKMGKFIY